MNNILKYNNAKEKLEQLQNHVQLLIKHINDYESRRQDLNDEEFNSYMKCIDDKIDIEAQIKKLKLEYDEVQYYTHTADILYKYYNLVEKGKDSMLLDPDFEGNKSNTSILKYFVSTPSKQPVQNELIDDVDESRGTLLEKYMMYTDETYLSKKIKDVDDACCFCNSSNITIMLHDGYAFCNECHTMEYLIVDHDKPSYKDPPKEISYFSYKRINHFQEFCMVIMVF